MKGKYIEDRVLEVVEYIIENKVTVRQASKHFGVSKSTIYKDCTERIAEINPKLANDVRKVLDWNKSERYVRGGLASHWGRPHKEHKS